MREFPRIFCLSRYDTAASLAAIWDNKFGMPPAGLTRAGIFNIVKLMTFRPAIEN
jgi:hypothetical protein